MAISYDSSGNPQVDFAWGNFPIQPNVGRVQSATIVVTNVLQADEKDGKQRFVVEDNTGLAVGDKITVALKEGTQGATPVDTTGIDISPLVNGEYEILSIESYLAGTNQSYVKTTANFKAFSFYTSPPSVDGIGKATKDVSNNVGGGKGDKYWSKTTKKRSEILDPTLDNHSVATSKWNGYPGYVPNVATTSLWEATLAPYSQVNMNMSGTIFNFERADFWANGMEGQQGYILRLFAPQSNEAFSTLQGYIDSDEIIGKSVDAFTVSLDYMGSAATANIPAGHIVAASAVDDYYNNTDIWLTVYTGTIPNLPTVSGMVIGQDQTWTESTEPINLVIGAGDNKSIVWKGTNVNDYGTAASYINGSGITFLSVQALPWGGTDLDADLVAAAGTDLSGALIGFSVPLSPYGGNPNIGQNGTGAIYSTVEVASASVEYDSYGKHQVTFATTVPSTPGVMGNGFYTSAFSSLEPYVITMYIVK